MNKIYFFSFLKSEAQMSFSDHSLFNVFRCCRRKISHLHRLLQNHLVAFNQTWHEEFLGKGLFKFKANYAFKGKVESLI